MCTYRASQFPWKHHHCLCAYCKFIVTFGPRGLHFEGPIPTRAFSPTFCPRWAPSPFRQAFASFSLLHFGALPTGFPPYSFAPLGLAFAGLETPSLLVYQVRSPRPWVDQDWFQVVWSPSRLGHIRGLQLPSAGLLTPGTSTPRPFSEYLFPGT
jgi:hypothetical protein